MTGYAEKVEILKLRADDLEKKIPFSVRFHPTVTAGKQLQAETFRLMQDMAEKLDAGVDHG